MRRKAAVDGIVKCVKNAETLIESAQALFRENRGVGTALLVTAVEEYGKVTLIMGRSAGMITEKTFCRQFRDHTFKRAYGAIHAIIGTAVVDGAKDAYRLRKMLRGLDFKAARDDALYVSYRSGGFQAPSTKVPGSVMVLRLALRLKRQLAALSEKKSCETVLADVLGTKPSDAAKAALIRRLLGIPQDLSR